MYMLSRSTWKISGQGLRKAESLRLLKRAGRLRKGSSLINIGTHSLGAQGFLMSVSEKDSSLAQSWP